MSLITSTSNNKSDKAEIQRRIAYVMELLSRKYKRSQILEHCLNETDWNVTSNTIGKYINRAKGELVNEIRKSAVQNMAESVMDLKELYRQAYSAGDIKTALAVRKELNAVLEVRISSIAATADEDDGISAELEQMVRDVTPTRSGRAR